MSNILALTSIYHDSSDDTINATVVDSSDAKLAKITLTVIDYYPETDAYDIDADVEFLSDVDFDETLPPAVFQALYNATTPDDDIMLVPSVERVEFTLNAI